MLCLFIVDTFISGTQQRSAKLAMVRKAADVIGMIKSTIVTT